MRVEWLQECQSRQEVHEAQGGGRRTTEADRQDQELPQGKQAKPNLGAQAGGEACIRDTGPKQ